MTAPPAEGPAAYSIYELLRALIERVGWPSEAEKTAALRSVDRAESGAVLGNMAEMIACPHPPVALQFGGKCGDCGKQVENTAESNRRDSESARYGYVPGLPSRPDNPPRGGNYPTW